MSSNPAPEGERREKVPPRRMGTAAPDERDRRYDPSMIDQRLRLDGRTIVVVGAGGGGIGTAVAKAVAEVGATVVGIDHDAERLDIGRDAVEGAGGTFVGHLADVRHKDEIDAAFAAAIESGGNIDGLVNVVGGQQPYHWQPLLDYPLEHLDEVLDLNLRYVLLTCQAAARSMITTGRGGSIVNIGSVAGYAATPFQMGYGVAKAALVAMTRTMAAEWGRHEIRVNIVAPGTTRTPRDRAGDDSDSERLKTLSLRRRGTAEELAGAVLFALSDLSSFVTGQSIVVDGGSLIRPSWLDLTDLPVWVTDGTIRERITDA